MKTTWLVAHDFTAAADHAMAVAAGDLEHLGGRLILFHAYRLPPVAGGLEAMANARGLTSWNTISERAEAGAIERLEDVAAKLRRRYPGVEVVTRVAEGAPTPTILEAADSERAARIVVGYSPRASLRRRFAGSVSEKILRDARVPVLLVKGD